MNKVELEVLDIDTFSNTEKRDEFLLSGTDEQWEFLLSTLKKTLDTEIIKKSIEGVVSKFIVEKLDGIDSTKQEEVNRLWLMLDSNLFVKLQKYQLVSMGYLKNIEEIFDGLLDLEFKTNQSLLSKISRFFDDESSRKERIKKIKFVTTVYEGLRKSI